MLDEKYVLSYVSIEYSLKHLCKVVQTFYAVSAGAWSRRPAPLNYLWRLENLQETLGPWSLNEAWSGFRSGFSWFQVFSLVFIGFSVHGTCLVNLWNGSIGMIGVSTGLREHLSLQCTKDTILYILKIFIVGKRSA